MQESIVSQVVVVECELRRAFVNLVRGDGDAETVQNVDDHRRIGGFVTTESHRGGVDAT